MLEDVDITRPGWVAHLLDIDITHTFCSAMGAPNKSVNPFPLDKIPQTPSPTFCNVGLSPPPPNHYFKRENWRAGCFPFEGIYIFSLWLSSQHERWQRLEPSPKFFFCRLPCNVFAFPLKPSTLDIKAITLLVRIGPDTPKLKFMLLPKLWGPVQKCLAFELIFPLRFLFRSIFCPNFLPLILWSSIEITTIGLSLKNLILRCFGCP